MNVILGTIYDAREFPPKNLKSSSCYCTGMWRAFPLQFRNHPPTTSVFQKSFQKTFHQKIEKETTTQKTSKQTVRFVCSHIQGAAAHFIAAIDWFIAMHLSPICVCDRTFVCLENCFSTWIHVSMCRFCKRKNGASQWCPSKFRTSK